jgi:hypothetical protein
MHLSLTLLEMKIRAEFGVKCSRRIARHLESTAPRRAILRERRDQNVPTRP